MTMPTYTGRSALALALAAVLLGGCADLEPMAPGTDLSEPPTRTALGVMEITISGIGGPEMNAAASPVAPGHPLAPSTQPDGPNLALVPVGGIGTGEDAESGIQLENLSTGSFTDRDQGVRYIWATYRVRNATAVTGGRGGTPYPVGRWNLTFLAVDDAATIGETPFSVLRRFDGSRADDAIAPAIVPTGAVNREPTTGKIVSSGPDVLQVLTEAEVAAIGAPEGVSAFPYGFVVSTGTYGRYLGADPAPDQFGGVVTFAFKLPLQESASDDPFTISFRALAVGDGETRITQSFEEQSPEGEAAFLRHARAVGASLLTVMPGSYVTTSPSRTVCTVRTAGSPASPSHLIGQPVTSLLSLSSHAHTPGIGYIAPNARFEATFEGAVTSANHNTFIVRGLQSGHQFRDRSYAGGGTPTITTAAARFFAGEEVEVTLSSRLCIDNPHVARFRVAAAPFSGELRPGDSYEIRGDPAGSPRATVILKDFNRDGYLDEILFSPHHKRIWLNYGYWDGGMWWTENYELREYPTHLAVGDLNSDGSLNFIASTGSGLDLYELRGEELNLQSYSNLWANSPIALRDFNGDGHADLVVASGAEVTILTGTGTFDFNPPRTVAGSGAGAPGSILMADFNGDGKLDAAVVHETGGGGPNLQVFLGNGDGTLTVGQSYAAYQLHGTSRATVGDFNGDGHPDIAIVADDGIRTLLGAGDGTFTPVATFPLDDVPTSIAAGDLNGDGALDLVAGYGKSFLTLTGAGDGTFGDLRQIATPDDAYAVAVGAMTVDGVLDVVVASSASLQRFLHQR